MIPAILGKKVGMTQVYDEEGNIVPVTVIQAGPCTVIQVKRAEGADKYDAVQLGFQDVKPHRSTKPMIGHAGKAGTGPKRFVRELRLTEPADANAGDVVTVEAFSTGDVKFVDVVGVTKGRGFAGVMKRWGFGGQPASHGTERKHRSPGSIGSNSGQTGQGNAVKKGKRMAGHFGHDQRTTRNHRLVRVDADNALLLVKGSIPGPNGGFVVVRQAKTKRG
ncbi:MAG: 50S ribosomal protein L3 [Phycisphaerae bacterium]|nr:50S ribosomal protein L3 [Phycisphaerae bacterium]